MKTVSLVRGDDRYLCIKNALKLIRNDIEVEDKERILIKPNLTSPSNPYANTDIMAVKAVIDFLKENFGKKDFLVVEGSGGAFLRGMKTEQVFERFGYYELRKEKVDVTALEEVDKFYRIPVKTFDGDSEVRIAEIDADYVISLAIPKTHDFAIATLGIKNMMGLIKQEDKVRIHGYCHLPRFGRLYVLERFIPGRLKRILSKTTTYLNSVRVIHHNLLSLAKQTLPDLVVLDAHYCMEGNGPINGTPVRMNACIASADALKADGIGVRIMGLEPEEIGYLYYIFKEGLGDYSTDNLVGERIEGVRRKFKMHSTIEIQKKWKSSKFS